MQDLGSPGLPWPPSEVPTATDSLYTSHMVRCKREKQNKVRKITTDLDYYLLWRGSLSAFGGSRIQFRSLTVLVFWL